MKRAFSSRRRASSLAAVAACVLGAISLGATTALACPSCPAGRTARQEVVDRDFASNVTVALAPFLVIGLIARWAEKRGDA